MFTRSLWESEGVPSLPNTDPQFADTIPPRDHLRNVEARPSTLRQMSLRLTVTALDTAERFEARALLDSGCTTSSIDRDFVKRKQLTTQTVEWRGGGRSVGWERVDSSLCYDDRGYSPESTLSRG